MFRKCICIPRLYVVVAEAEVSSTDKETEMSRWFVMQIFGFLSLVQGFTCLRSNKKKTLLLMFSYGKHF